MMKRLNSRRLVVPLIAIGLIATALVLIWRSLDDEEKAYPAVAASSLLDAVFGEEGEMDSHSYLMSLHTPAYSESAYREGESVRITIPALAYAASSEDAKLARHDDEQRGEVLRWSNGTGWVEWHVEVPEDGVYGIEALYKPMDQGFSPIVRGVAIDGELSFQEAAHIELPRYWKDGDRPYPRNAIGNEIMPVPQEVLEWQLEGLKDYSVSSESLLWKLSQGEHTIRLVGVREAMALHSLTLYKPEGLPSYAEYRNRHSEDKLAEDERLWHMQIEAEQFSRKSSVSLRTVSVAEPFISPDPKGRLVYNAVGGDSWRNAGERIDWEVEVPHDGYYAIDVKYFQGYNRGASVYRTIMLDGRIPFREMRSYRFSANRGMELAALANDDGEPYLFYMEKGKHVLSMIADTSPAKPATAAMIELGRQLTSIIGEIRLISGNYGFGDTQNLDDGRVWELSKYAPDMEAKLQSLRGGLLDIRAYVLGLHGYDSDSASALSSSANKVEHLLEDIENLPHEIKTLMNIQSSLNNLLKPLESSSLQLDYLVVRTPGAKPELPMPDRWDRTKYAATNFARTFFQRYDTNEENDEDALTVWVMRGREYTDLLQMLIQQEFTPLTGIEVNVNLIADPNVLLMGNAAGNQPDVALGASMEAPVDFAMRGAAEDLSAYPGFQDVMERFNPGIMRSYAYDGGIYGLPETQMYNMLFYRKDILEELGLAPPDTWEDVVALLPTLQENGMSFMFPKLAMMLEHQGGNLTSRPDFVLPFYQQGAPFFTSDGMEPTLTSQEGIAAFKRWTEWFTKYNLPREVPNFFNHFRSGLMPVGVGDLTMYTQLMTAAPELVGQWGMLPVPGVAREDGTVARWGPQLTTSAFIMRGSDKKDEAWKFMEWWTSEEVQSRYGTDIEAYGGIIYRWHTANLKAMTLLPWSEEELRQLQEQSRWAKNIPLVPGYYFLARELDFAWNAVVVEGDPPREALEKAELSLRREMQRKQKEFGMSEETDLSIDRYNEPYEGGIER
ncbi:extracellular solute-binding protein [Paenibacillus sp. J5C_2022]|uniref:extracellular solute-binding protein n=1 Tax=Paenibacillus sp. J5C2022 TaxID=2977129 RepID=UPI0021D3670E|nr:extracellular solute-binding protein [Paenibacillus sp. J5C2022]MCU6711595.1 extracellular solute-binding protein [Paenibacillus sp. J5C2022]